MGNDQDLPDFQGLAGNGVLVGFLDFIDAILGVAGIHFAGDFPEAVALDDFIGAARAGIGGGGRRASRRDEDIRGIKRQGARRGRSDRGGGSRGRRA